MNFRVSVDTGGTFTDVVVADKTGRLHIGKAATTPERVYTGLSASLDEPTSFRRFAVPLLSAVLGSSMSALNTCPARPSCRPLHRGDLCAL
jgi:N-methylhydantoinase A/oxoprolinase/acetone carboxylase beta subunit